MQDLLKTALLGTLAWVCASANAQVTEHTVCEGELVQFALENAHKTGIIWEYSPDGKEWSLYDISDGGHTPAHSGMVGYYRAACWDTVCNAYQYSAVQQVTVRPLAERLALEVKPANGANGGLMLYVKGNKELKEVDYVINGEAMRGKANGFHIPVSKLPAIVYARNSNNCEQSPVQLITLPSGDAKCNVSGGTLSTNDPRLNLCLNEGQKTIQFGATETVGAGRFVLVDANTLTLVASNATGLFSMNNYPAGSYIAVYVSVNSLQELNGVTHPALLPVCHSLSNTLLVSTFSLSGGSISANGATTLTGGELSFSVTANEGPNQRWVLLNPAATEALAINTSGQFNFDGYEEGIYRVVHIAYSQGVNLALINPQNPQGCLSASNVILVNLETSVGCPPSVTFEYKGELVTYGTVVGANGRCWLDRNLGASQVATSSTDEAAYGDLFQWGRGDDGHQNRTSNTTSTLSSTDQPLHSNFILAPNNPNDWRSPRNDNLWQGENGINNPCPQGWRIPTNEEWNTERLSWSVSSSVGAFESPLKLTTGGERNCFDNSIYYLGVNGYYWSSSVSTSFARRLRVYPSTAGVYFFFRGYGSSVRCIME